MGHEGQLIIHQAEQKGRQSNERISCANAKVHKAGMSRGQCAVWRASSTGSQMGRQEGIGESRLPGFQVGYLGGCTLEIQ